MKDNSKKQYVMLQLCTISQEKKNTSINSNTNYPRI